MHRFLIFLFLAISTITPAFADATLDLARHKGKVLYVDFWASWCVPCKQSFPWMNRMHEKYHDLGLEIIAVNLDEDPAMADRFLKAYPARFRIIRDPEGRLAEKYQIQGMPTALLFDRNGKLTERHIGFKTEEADHHESLLRKLLSGKTLASERRRTP